MSEKILDYFRTFSPLQFAAILILLTENDRVIRTFSSFLFSEVLKMPE